MSDKIFADGLSVNVTETQHGEIIKLGINKEKFIDFLLKYVNNAGYVNVDILTNKEGKKYAVLNTYKKPEETKSDENIVKFSEEDIPF